MTGSESRKNLACNNGKHTKKQHVRQNTPIGPYICVESAKVSVNLQWHVSVPFQYLVRGSLAVRPQRTSINYIMRDKFRSIVFVRAEFRFYFLDCIRHSPICCTLYFIYLINPRRDRIGSQEKCCMHRLTTQYQAQKNNMYDEILK